MTGLLALWTFVNLVEPEIQQVELEPSEIVEHLKRKRKDVKVFELIREEAEKLGVRVFLFGGTAASFAYYSSWDLRRVRGDKRFQDLRFDFDFTNIYASTQDADLVIDGSAQLAHELEERLKARAQYLTGNKVKWEIRTLHHPRGDKMPLLNDFDFANQHTDSASVGLIELTDPPKGEPLVRDLRYWHEENPPFLKGIAKNFLLYYYSPTHAQTTRFRLGLNPSIISVIRFATKAFQFNLKILPEDSELIKKIVSEFNPSEVAESDYLSYWIKKNALKLFLNAMDVNYAAKVMDEWGLREKLIQIGDPKLSYWMGRLPLGSFEVGKGEGKTAEALGINKVAHETRNFLHFEAITRSPMGVPNLFSSRPGGQGYAVQTKQGIVEQDFESAGIAGFYTRIGREGARGTGLTIRFRMKPEAREGSDFTHQGSYVVVHNRNALEVIYEEVSLSPLQFLNMLYLQKWDNSDLGLLLRFSRRIKASGMVETLRPFEKKRAILKIMELIRRERKSELHFIGQFAKNYSDLIKGIPALQSLYAEAFAELTRTEGQHSDIVHVAQNAIGLGLDGAYLKALLPEFDGVALRALSRDTLSKPASVSMGEIMLLMLKHPETDESVIEVLIAEALSQPFHAEKIEVVKEILKRPLSDRLGKVWVEKVLRQPHAAAWVSVLLPVLVERGGRMTHLALIRDFLSRSENAQHLSYLREALDDRDIFTMRAAVIFLGDVIEKKKLDDWVERFLDLKDPLIQTSLQSRCPQALKRVAIRKGKKT